MVHRHNLSGTPDQYNAYGKHWEAKIITAVEDWLNDHEVQDDIEQLQGTYNYLKKREFMMNEGNEPRALVRRRSLPNFIHRLLGLMNSRTPEFGG